MFVLWCSVVLLLLGGLLFIACGVDRPCGFVLIRDRLVVGVWYCEGLLWIGWFGLYFDVIVLGFNSWLGFCLVYVVCVVMVDFGITIACECLVTGCLWLTAGFGVRCGLVGLGCLLIVLL